MTGVQWAKTSKEDPVSDTSATLADTYDLAVVGAGFCGLNIALHAAKAGMSVVLLEAGSIGCGASGRNGGIAVPHFPGALLPGDVEAMIGKHRAGRLFDIVSGGPGFVFDQIHQYQIQCDAEQKGWMQPAHSQKSLKKVRKVFEQWKALGSEAEWLSAGDVTDRIGTYGHLGGWVDETGITVNPYALTQGLARAAVSHGVHIRQNAAVTDIRREGALKTLTAGKDRINARKVAFATNAHTPGLYPGVDRTVIPVRLFHAFTRPLSDDELAHVLPTRTPFTDLRKSGGFARLDSENRLLTGGAVFALGGGESYSRRHGRHRIATLFPRLKGVTLERYWEGYCALSESALPSIRQLDDGVYSVLGFSTRGVALSQTLGREMAAFLAESLAADDLPLEISRVETIPFQRVKTKLGGYAFPVYQARDALGLS